MSNIKIGPNIIKEHLSRLSNKPGVYQMFDPHGHALYIGKAKALKKRVASYTQIGRLNARLLKMVNQVASMEFIETHTEAEALLLEANLIKKKKPKYNILLRDDKSFPYLLLPKDHPFPRLSKHRGAKKTKGDYFGPFASVKAVNHTLEILQRIFMIRNCSDHDFATRKRPCLQYHIKRCSAPCVGHVSRKQYALQIKDVHDYLSGRSQNIQKRFAADMQKASDALDFEQAAILRDKIKALSMVQSKQDIHVTSLPDTDVICAKQEGSFTCVQIFFFRSGHNYGSRTYLPKVNQDDSLAEIIQNFIAQFYENKPIPKDILVSTALTDHALLSEALTHKSGHKVEIKANLRGQRKRLIEWANNNLNAEFSRLHSQSQNDQKACAELANLFNMEEPPQRIEIYDNSHISGENMVGGMVVSGPDGFQKSQYRKFNMKEANAQDDFDMMREVMRRRFSRALKENHGPGSNSWPDLLLIDGGKGQLSAVTEVLQELGVYDDLCVVAISKGPDRNAGREEFHMNDRTAFRLAEKDPTLYYLQRLRDEAHRFAIGAHRTRRKKALTGSTLDNLPGVGAKRKKALLLHFGSAKAVQEAGISDLERAEGISRNLAEKIYDYFHENH